MQDRKGNVGTTKQPQKFIQRHSLTVFFALAYGISWSIWGSLFVIAPGGLDTSAGNTAMLLPALLGGIGSSTSGIIVTRVALGKDGLHFLFSRLKQKSGPIWYLLAIFTTPILLITTLAITGRTIESGVLSQIDLGVMVGLIAASIEEFGWRGFALPSLQRKYNSAIISSLTLGSMWALWHILPSYWGSGNTYGVLWLPSFLTFALSLVAYSVFITWVFNRTRGNMLIAIVLHASYTGSQFILFPPALSPAENILLTGVFMMLLWAVGALLSIKRPSGMTGATAYKLKVSGAAAASSRNESRS